MAIDRNELRLGDLVEWNGKVWRVDEINSVGCLLHYKTQTEDKRAWWVTCQELTPIEITKEILDHNQFDAGWGTIRTFWKVVNDHLEYRVDYDFEKGEIKTKSMDYKTGEVLLSFTETSKYLHVLQNTMWDAGINKEVTIC